MLNIFFQVQCRDADKNVRVDGMCQEYTSRVLCLQPCERTVYTSTEEDG